MYSLEELKSWWEVPAIAHFFSLFKSCFSLTDFTIEELEECLLTDGIDEKATSFTSRLLTELLQGCYGNPNISMSTYHDSLIHIMKTRWELEDGRVNPLSSLNADFHSLPTQLKVLIIHRLTEYRLDANDVESKLGGLNPADLRLEPLGMDRNGSKYWYFFGVRLYKETPAPSSVKKPPKKRKHEYKVNKKESKKPKLHPGTISETFLKMVSGESRETLGGLDTSFNLFKSGCDLKEKKGKKKSKKKHKQKKCNLSDLNTGLRSGGSGNRSKWEVVCYNVEDWEKLSKSLSGGSSLGEEALCRLITDNFLPNLPKIVEDMEMQRLQKEQLEQIPRRSSCRLLAKKLYEEEDGLTSIHVERLKKEQREREEVQIKEREERMNIDFAKMLELEIKRKRKETYARWKKDREERKKKRLSEGLPPESESSSDENLLLDDSILQSRLDISIRNTTSDENNKLTAESDEAVKVAVDDRPEKTLNRVANVKVPKRRGRPPLKAKKSNELAVQGRKLSVGRGRKKSTDWKKKKAEPISGEETDQEPELYLKDAGDHEYIAMKEAWEVLDSRKEAWPFQKPVQDWYAPGYHDIIKRPMDLETIETKLVQRKYTMVTDFKSDIILMFNNCRLYNGPDSEYTGLANRLEKRFHKSLYVALTKKRVPVQPRKKPGRPRKLLSKENQEIEKPPPQEKFMDLAEADLELEEESSDEESSDEFTPPGVSKKKLRQSRLESLGRRGSIVRRGRGRGRGRGSISHLPRSEMSKPSDESSDESEDDAPKKSSQPISGVVGRGRGRGRGRGKSKRGRKPLNADKRRKSIASRDSDSESPIRKDSKQSESFLRRRGRGRGSRGRGRGRGRGRRASAPATDNRSSSESSSESEDSENSTDSNPVLSDKEEVDADGKQAGVDTFSPEKSKSVKSPFEEHQSDSSPVKVDKLSERDRESSSSSSRASSRSRSPEKIEKTEEMPKTKPLQWSLDYLASQARVLDEQNDSSASSRKKSQSTSERTHEEARKSFFSSPRRLSKGSKSHESSGEENLKTDDSSDTTRTAPRRPLPTEHRKRESDIYSFNDEESPMGMFKRMMEHPSKVDVPSSKIDSLSKESLITSSDAPISLSECQNDSNLESKIVSSKARQLSSEQLSSPMTPSSGYGSARAASSGVSHHSASPYSASDNSVGMSRNSDKVSPAKNLSIDNIKIGTKPAPKDDKEKPPVIPSTSFPPPPTHYLQEKEELQRIKSTPTTTASPYSKDRFSPAQRSLSSQPPVQYLPPEERSVMSSTNSSWTQQQVSSYPSKSPASVPSKPMQITSRRHSQTVVAPSPRVNSPGYQQACQANATNTAPISQTTHKPPAAMRQHSNPNTSLPPKTPPLHIAAQRLPSYNRQSQSNTQVPSDLSQGMARRSPSVPNPSQQTASHSYERRLSSRSMENYRSPGSAQQGYAYTTSTSSNPNQINPGVMSLDKPAYHSRGDPSSSNVVPQNVSLANYGMSSHSLAQAPHGTTAIPSGQSQSAPRKASLSSGQPSSYQQTSKSTSHSVHLPTQQQQQHGAMQHRSAPSYNTSTSIPSSTTQQHTPSAGSHHPTKHRTPSQTSNTSESAGANKHLSRQSATGSSNHQQQAHPPTASSSMSSRRQSSGASAQYQQKPQSDYPGNYHVPPASAPNPRESRSSYPASAQNGLLTAAATGSVGMHQDLTASATLRALQQQHKADRPSHASMQYASLIQQTQAAANEQFRLAASARHHATTQHTHPLAGVYHPHHQNVATSSAHQSATHLSTPLSSPWLQANPAAAAAGYPSNLLPPPPHMDPVYQLMQQSGMHGQYPMYPNHVMQQLHQQHLQHHMLPKY